MEDLFQYFLMMWELEIMSIIEQETGLDCSINDYLEDE